MRGDHVRAVGRLLIVAWAVATVLVPFAAAGQTAGSSASSPEQVESDELNKQLNNPVSTIWSFNFQNNFQFFEGHLANQTHWQYNLNFQPVLPLRLTDDWNLITRPIFPVFAGVDVPDPARGTFDEHSGFGDMSLSSFLSPAKVSGLLWGAGPSFIFPTASSDALGAGKWQAGLVVLGLYMGKEWIVGGLLNRGGHSLDPTIGRRSLWITPVRAAPRITTGGRKTRTPTSTSTTIDNWFVLGKYDYFLTKQLYLYGSARVEQDQIADLDLRLTLSGGPGYQWFETPTFNLFTEAGLAWVYEDFSNKGTEDHIAARLAYHVDWTPYKTIKLFHNLEWLPNFTDWFGDYNLNVDAGVRATIYGGFFAEAKIELRYDATPAPGAKKDDVRYLLGVGWSF